MVVDFGEMKAFDTILISEFFDTYNTPNDYRCTKFNVEYFDGTEWKLFHEGTAIGEKLVIAKDPVIGSKVRLNLLGTKANGGKSPANILEFEIYSTKEVPAKTEFDVRVNGEVVQTGAYNTKVTITAPEAPEGKEFTGWKLNGIVVSKAPSYTFYIAGDMDFEACYDAVEAVPAAMLTGTQVTKRTDGKSDLKFVAQLAVPEGYTVVDAGLLWLSNDNETEWGTEEAIADGVKVTHITKMNVSGQFSVTIKGVPAGRFVRGVVYAKVTNGTETFVYSQEQKVMAK